MLADVFPLFTRIQVRVSVIFVIESYVWRSTCDSIVTVLGIRYIVEFLQESSSFG